MYEPSALFNILIKIIIKTLAKQSFDFNSFLVLTFQLVEPSGFRWSLTLWSFQMCISVPFLVLLDLAFRNTHRVFFSTLHLSDASHSDNSLGCNDMF